MNTLSSSIPANEARANFYQILDEAADKLRQFTVTLRGKSKVVIMAAEEFEGWLETLEIMSDKNLVADIKKGLASKKRYTEAEVNKILKW
ncbi:MAG: type II toxin-antitoxin system Phd/YefM family antitoxin [Patescibacteria group bacterium]